MTRPLTSEAMSCKAVRETIIAVLHNFRKAGFEPANRRKRDIQKIHMQDLTNLLTLYGAARCGASTLILAIQEHIETCPCCQAYEQELICEE